MPNTGGYDGSIIIDTELDYDGFRAGSEKMEKSIKELGDTFKAQGEKMAAAFSALLPVLSSVAENTAQISAMLNGTSEQTADASARVASAAEQAEANTRGAATATKDYDKALARVQSQIEKARAKLTDYYRAVAEVKASTDSMLPNAATDEQAANVMELEETQIAALNEKYAAQLTALQELEAEYARLSALRTRAAADAAAERGNPAGVESNESAWARFGATMKSVGIAALQTGKNLAKMPFTATTKGVQRLTSSFKDCWKKAATAKTHTNSLVKSLTSLKRLLVTRIKRMFISGIINQAKESLQTLAKFSDAFNSSMSGIKNSAKQLAGSIAVSMGHVINSLSPLITGLLDKVSQAITYINALFAMLGGKTTMTVAKKQTDSYRDSLKGAAGAAEDLKNQVYGFDKLNKRSDNDSGGAGIADLYEEVPIDSVLPDKLKSLFEELKALWDNGEYFNFGKRIGESFNDMVDTVDDWINGTLRPKGVEWAGKIAEVFNGLFTGVNWENLGKNVADAFNAIAVTVETFFKTLNFKTVADAISDFFAGALQTVDPLALATAYLLPKLLKATITFVAANPVFAIVAGAILALGPRLGETLQKMVDHIDFAAVGKKLSDGVKWVVNRITGAVESVDWSQLTKSLLDGLMEMVRNIDWGGIVKAAFELLGAAVGGAVDLVAGLIEAITGILTNAISSIGEYFREKIQECGGNIIQGLFQGIKDALAGVGTWIYENIFKPFIDGFKKAFGINSPSTVMAEQGHFIIEGLLNGIKEKWGAVKSFISTAMANMKERITTTADQIKTTIANKWDSIKTNTISKWTEIKSSVTERWNNLKTQLKSTEWGSVGNHLVTGLKNGIVNAWTSLKTTVANLAQRLTDTLKNAFSINSPSKVWAQIGEYLDLGLKQGLEDKSRAILATVSNLAQNVSERMAGSEALISADFNGDGALSSLSGIADKLMLIADVFRGISNMITNIGDIRIPAIAYGSAVPYKTRIADNSGSDPFSGDAFNSFSNGLDERLYDQNLLLNKILDRLEKNGSVDNRELAQAIALALQGMPRGFGGAY